MPLCRRPAEVFHQESPERQNVANVDHLRRNPAGRRGTDVPTVGDRPSASTTPLLKESSLRRTRGGSLFKVKWVDLNPPASADTAAAMTKESSRLRWLHRCRRGGGAVAPAAMSGRRPIGVPTRYACPRFTLPLYRATRRPSLRSAGATSVSEVNLPPPTA